VWSWPTRHTNIKILGPKRVWIAPLTTTTRPKRGAEAKAASDTRRAAEAKAAADTRRAAEAAASRIAVDQVRRLTAAALHRGGDELARAHAGSRRHQLSDLFATNAGRPTPVSARLRRRFKLPRQLLPAQRPARTNMFYVTINPTVNSTAKVWAMLRVWSVVEAAVGKWSAQPFVEEQK
jgi:hypothetical protein